MTDSSTILVADDDPIGRKLIQTKLFGEKYNLVFAGDGKEALEKIRETLPDLVLLDVMMPEMDGFTVCETMRADSQLKHIPVVMVTALDGRDDVMRGAQVGANDFLRKPVNSFELRARVRSLLGVKKQLSTVDAQMQFRNNLETAITDHISPVMDDIFTLGSNLRQRATEPLDVDESKKLLEHSKNLQALVNSLLLLVKSEKDGFILKKQPTDLNKRLQAIFEKLQPIAKAKLVNVTLDLPDESREVPLDGSLFTHMMSNLLAHILETVSSKGTITLQAKYPSGETAQDRIRIEVIDDAPSIPEQKYADLFAAAKPDDENLNFPGFGAGLAVCKKIAKAHGGNIAIKANEPDGNIYTIEI